MKVGDRCLAKSTEITADRYMPATIQAVTEAQIAVEFDTGEICHLHESQIMDRAKTEKLIRAEERARKRMRRAHHKVRTLVENKKRFNPTNLRPRLEAYNKATEAYLQASEALDALL